LKRGTWFNSNLWDLLYGLSFLDQAYFVTSVKPEVGKVAKAFFTSALQSE